MKVSEWLYRHGLLKYLKSGDRSTLRQIELGGHNKWGDEYVSQLLIQIASLRKDVYEAKEELSCKKTMMILDSSLDVSPIK